MTQTMVTFDATGMTAEERKNAYKALERYGLQSTEPEGKLPRTTVVGDTSALGATAQEVLDSVKSLIQMNSTSGTVTRIAVQFGEDSASENDDDDEMTKHHAMVRRVASKSERILAAADEILALAEKKLP